GPADGVAGSVGVRVVATRHHVAFLGPRARVDPAATGSAAIGAQFAEVLQLLTLATNYLAVFIGQVLQRPTVVLHRQLGGGGDVGPLVVPAQVEDRIREGAALILIQLLDPQHELAKNFRVGHRLTRARCGTLVPLQPARAVGDGAVVLGEAGGGQAEHLGADLRRIDV